MQEFLITYDLHWPEEHYEIIDALKEHGAIRVQKSVWFLKDRDEDKTCKSLRAIFTQYIRAGDRLLVVLMDDWSSRNSLSKS